MLKNIPENIKIIITNSAPLAVVLILFLTVGNFGIAKVREIGTQVDRATIDKNVLTQKLDVLQTVNQTLGDAPNLATAALPSSNAVLLSVSQLKNLAFVNTLVLSNIKAGSESKDATGLSKADISFEVSGTRPQIIAFLKATQGVAPIILVDAVKLNESGGVARGTITAKTFWAPLPQTLPSVISAVSDLSSDEKKILISITSLTQPTFLVLPPASTGGKADPFSP